MDYDFSLSRDRDCLQTVAMQWKLNNWKLVLRVTPRGGVNTVRSLIRTLEPGSNADKDFRFSGSPPKDFLAVKFVRNPYARAVSQFIMYGCRTEENSHMTFREFIKHLGTMNLYGCDPHWGYQFKKGDRKTWELIKMEEFGEFVRRLNEFGNHSFTIGDFTASHLKQKVNTDENFYDVSYREIFDRFNQDGDPFMADRKRRSAKYYYLKVEPRFKIPSYFAFYDESMKKLVYNRFKWDIDHLGYTFDEMIELNHPDDLRTIESR